MAIRDHLPLVVEDFNGLWKRGDPDSCPQDHFSDCNNISFIQSGFRTRDGIGVWMPQANIVRIYTYTKQGTESILMLDTSNNIYDSDYPGTVIMNVSGMTDFGFFAFDGRAYITPTDGNLGLAGEFLYVYMGDGTPARVAAGIKPKDADSTGGFTAANSGTGHVEAGIHIFGCVYETDTGFLTAIGPDTLVQVTATGTNSVLISNIPVSPNAYVKKVHIVGTKLILPSLFTGDLKGYQFMFIPGAVVTNGTTSVTVDFYDADLLEDATYLLNVFDQIAAPLGLGLYHNRMLAWAEHDNPSIIRISDVGDPETIDNVDGIVIFPLDGNPINAAQEYRDVLYAFKKTKTVSWSDNGDVPSGWPMTIIDNGTGCTVHGVGEVLDSEGINIDYLIVGGLAGIYVFDGIFNKPELSWKIFDLWNNVVTRNADFPLKYQMLNNSIEKILYLVLPDGTMMICDYSMGFDMKSVRWAPWSFDINVTSISILTPGTLIIASNGQRSSLLVSESGHFTGR